MRFLIDESADARLAVHLRCLGHDVTPVAADYAPATKDLDVLRIAVREQRILITFDHHFDRHLTGDSDTGAPWRNGAK